MKPIVLNPGQTDVMERIDVVRIKLIRSTGSAVVSELRAADLLLLNWANHGGGERALNFEVTFLDGYTVAGRYDYGQHRKGRPSLSRFVRHVFKALQETPASWPDGTCFLNGPKSDLTCYAIDA